MDNYPAWIAGNWIRDNIYLYTPMLDYNAQDINIALVPTAEPYSVSLTEDGNCNNCGANFYNQLSRSIMTTPSTVSKILTPYDEHWLLLGVFYTLCLSVCQSVCLSVCRSHCPVVHFFMFFKCSIVYSGFWVHVGVSNLAPVDTIN